MKPGPKKGHGGRPRNTKGKGAVDSEGYKRMTVGPKGKGRQVRQHRAIAYNGNPPKGSKGGSTVDHKNRRKTDNSKGNLRKVSRGKNNKNR